MTNLLELRHKFEFWKREYSRDKSPVNLSKMQKYFQDYMNFIDNKGISLKEIQDLNERYEHVNYVFSENVKDAPPPRMVENKDKDANHVSSVLKYLESKKGKWTPLSEILKSLSLSDSYLRPLMEYLIRKGFVQKLKRNRKIFYAKAA